MKKYTRQRLILNLIEENEIQTQEELSEYLKERGVRATQATISRDIIQGKVLDTENIAAADILIRPEVGEMSAADLSHAYQTIEKGFSAAKESLKNIKTTIIDNTEESFFFE